MTTRVQPRLGSLLLALVAMVPFYGYVVHAARDTQIVALVIIACWLLTCIAAVVAMGKTLIKPPDSPHQLRALSVASGALALAAVLGCGGVRAAFSELLAG